VTDSVTLSEFTDSLTEESALFVSVQAVSIQLQQSKAVTADIILVIFITVISLSGLNLRI
jgi:hypothetical protein